MSASSSSSSSGSSSRAAPRRDDHRPAKLRQAPAETRRRKRTNSLRIVIAAEPSQASTSTPRRPQARAAQSRAGQSRAEQPSAAEHGNARTHASLAVEAEATMRVPVRPVGHLRQTSCSLAYLPACLPACQPASVPAGVPAWPRRGASSGAAAQSSRGRQSEASSFLLDPGAGPGYLWEAYLLITRDLGR